jgi:ABC-type multidrug transport system ATPase subunit
MISLEVKQLQKSFGPKTVFSDLSFTHRQNALGIAGPNGSGKSTLLKCLAYLLRPNRGNIEWKNEGEILQREKFKNMLGYAAPYINLYDELSCIENLQFVAKMRHEANFEDSIEQWIQNVELKQVADQPFGKLSTGQQQRLRLASALFHQPDILMLDEPGANLDESGWDLIGETVESFKAPGKMLIIASNNRDELNLCERIFSVDAEAFA